MKFFIILISFVFIVSCKMGEQEKANEIISLAKQYSDEGYSMNEDNEIYERYPYQVRF